MTHAIADTGATSIFIMKGTPVKNLRKSNNPITISLPDGSKVTSTHICDITIPGLPTVLTGHIVPGITMASLIGIRILCKAGCKVVFDDEKCEVIYKNNIILRGYKDPTTDLWTLPIFDEAEVAKTTPESSLVRPQRAHMMLSHHVKHAEAPIKHAMVSEQPSPWVHKSCVPKPIQLRPGPCLGRTQRNPIVETAGFSYARTTKINNVKFAHQSFGNPPIASILKAINAGFLKGAPHLDAQTVRKYLVSSPATAKGHMKRPRKGIHSTTPKETTHAPNTHILRTPQRVPDVTMPGLVCLNENKEDRVPILPLHNLIDDIEDESIANLFCFGAFADKISGFVYNLYGRFPIHVPGQKHMFLRDVPLRNQCDTHHPNRGPGFGTNIGGIHKKLRIFGEQRIQTKSQCDGQPSHQSNHGLPHPAAGNTSIG